MASLRRNYWFFIWFDLFNSFSELLIFVTSLLQFEYTRGKAKPNRSVILMSSQLYFLRDVMYEVNFNDICIPVIFNEGIN